MRKQPNEKVTKNDLKKYKGGRYVKLFTPVLTALHSFGLQLNQSTIRSFADFICGLIITHSVNTIKLGSSIPRATTGEMAGTKVLTRFLQNPRVDPPTIMAEFIKPILKGAVKHGQTLYFMMDQSTINKKHEVLMISVRYKGRAKPIMWTVKNWGRGGIGFSDQHPLLLKFAEMLKQYPQLEFVFTADRFYGTRKLIEFCQIRNWQYRLRMKGDLWIDHNGRIIQTCQIANKFPNGIDYATLGNSLVKTSIYMIKADQKDEPWIIAMDGEPTKEKTLQYGKRWGIEPMFSDLKSRGFNITKTRLRHCDRIERLILCAAAALYFCIGLAAQLKPYWDDFSEAKAKRSKLAPFQFGLRQFIFLWKNRVLMPKFWRYMGDLFKPNIAEASQQRCLL